jgi:hypothetical protein
MKKQILYSVLFAFVSFITYAQDIIYKNDKTEVKAKIIEVLDDEIKYKKHEFLDGPTYTMQKNEIYMIVYKNGQKEMMEDNSRTTNKSKIASGQTNKKSSNTSEYAISRATVNVMDLGVTLNNIGAYDIPNIVVTGDISIKKNIAAQIYASGNSLSTEIPFSGKVTVTSTFLGARANYFLNEVLKIDPAKYHLFGGITLGYFSAITTGSKTNIPSQGKIDYFGQIGGRYFFGEKLGVKTELQFAKGGTNIMVGLCYRVVIKGK